MSNLLSCELCTKFKAINKESFKDPEQCLLWILGDKDCPYEATECSIIIPARLTAKIEDFIVECIEDERKIKEEILLLKKAEDFWQENISYINENAALSSDQFFKWNQLVWQEIWMWCKSTKRVSKQEFEQVCSIRKLDEKQVAFLEKALKYLEIEQIEGENERKR
jgi:hypothetical protein